MDQGFQYDEEAEAEAKADVEAVIASMDEASRRLLSDVEVEVRMDDLPEWMFAETSTRDLKCFRLTINRVRYREADEGERLWRLAHELGRLIHILTERGRLTPPGREVILSGDEADANALALLWGFKPPRAVVESEVLEAYREAVEGGFKGGDLIRYVAYRSGFSPEVVGEVLRRIRGLLCP